MEGDIFKVQLISFKGENGSAEEESGKMRRKKKKFLESFAEEIQNDNLMAQRWSSVIYKEERLKRLVSSSVL